MNLRGDGILNESSLTENSEFTEVNKGTHTVPLYKFSVKCRDFKLY